MAPFIAQAWDHHSTASENFSLTALIAFLDCEKKLYFLLILVTGLECYNCFTIDVQGTHIQAKGEELEECSLNKTEWNTWQCPDERPYCSSMLYEGISPKS